MQLVSSVESVASTTLPISLLVTKILKEAAVEDNTSKCLILLLSGEQIE